MEIKRNDPCPCGSGKRYKKCCAVGKVEVLSSPPSQASSYVNQGYAMYQRGDFEQALRLYSEALSVDPKYLLAYFNIGGVLRELGRLEESIASYEKALSLMPQDSELCVMLGVLYERLGRKKEADSCYQNALSCEHESAEAYVKLGDCLVNFGLMKEADICYEKALKSNPAYAKAYCNYGYSLLLQGVIREAVENFRKALALEPDYPTVFICLAVIHFIEKDFASCRKYLDLIPGSPNAIGNRDEKFIWPYYYFLQKMVCYIDANQEEYAINDGLPALYVIGDSHSLSMANVEVSLKGVSYAAVPKLIIGCKAWHLSSSERNRYKSGFERLIESIPVGSTVLVNIGEIDCRLDEGIIVNHKKRNNNLAEAICELVRGYVDFVSNKCASRGINPIICNIPMRLIGEDKISDSDKEMLGVVLEKFNKSLSDNCAKRQIQVLDVNGLSKNDDGTAKPECHLDNFHLLPSFFVRLMRQF